LDRPFIPSDDGSRLGVFFSNSFMFARSFLVVQRALPESRLLLSVGDAEIFLSIGGRFEISQGNRPRMAVQSY
jgi:hypothetical protein